MFRFIVRPPHLHTTPLLLKEHLNARLTIPYPKRMDKPYDWSKDFFLIYPPESLVVGTNDSYHRARNFCGRNKGEQRRLLSNEGIPTPKTETVRHRASSLSSGGGGLRYIVRPNYHYGGAGWRITEDPQDFEEGAEYIQEVYPKNYEYRVICIRGVPIITLLKRVPEGTPHDRPWNHSFGSFFVTVNNPENNRLRHTNIYEVIESSDLIKSFHICGIDVMYRRHGDYRVSEINTCPSLKIVSNLETIASHIRQTWR